jgi:hypothetical protein
MPKVKALKGQIISCRCLIILLIVGDNNEIYQVEYGLYKYRRNRNNSTYTLQGRAT